jgi:hypothetical protein
MTPSTGMIDGFVDGVMILHGDKELFGYLNNYIESIYYKFPDIAIITISCGKVGFTIKIFVRNNKNLENDIEEELKNMMKKDGWE